MISKLRILAMLLILTLLTAACNHGTEAPTRPEGTSPSETVQAEDEPEKLYLFYFHASGGNPFLTNAEQTVSSKDTNNPYRMGTAFSTQKLGKGETLYLHLPRLMLTREMPGLTLELECFRTPADPEYSFRISWSGDNGVTWTELTDVAAPEATGDKFSNAYPVMSLSLEDMQNQIPEGMTVTDLRLEPYAKHVGKNADFHLLRAAIYCRGPQEVLSDSWVTEKTMGKIKINGTEATKLTGTVEGETVSVQGYLPKKDTFLVTCRVWITVENQHPRAVLRVLVPEGEHPVLPAALYSLDARKWLGPLDMEVRKQPQSFVTDENIRYDIYTITSPVPLEANAVQRIQWEFPVTGKELFVLDATVVSHAQRDDAPMIQKMIDDAKAAGQNEIVIPAVNPETGRPCYDIGSTVWLSSDTTVILDGCYMRFNDRVMCNMFASLGAWDASDDPVVMAGHKNIRILGQNGAIFDGGNSNGKTEKTVESGESMMWNSFVLMRNVDGFEVSGIKAVSSRYWCFTFLYGRNGSIHDIEFDCRNEKPNQDGIDLRQGCNNIDIYNLTGITGDDTVALTAIGRNTAWHVVEGIEDIDIHDVTIRNVRAGCSGGHGVIRLLAQDGKKVYNVTISDIYDGAVEGNGKSCYGLLRIGDVRYFSETPQAMGDITGITVENVVSAAATAILVNNENITKDHISWTNVTAEAGTVIEVLDEAKFYGND